MPQNHTCKTIYSTETNGLVNEQNKKGKHNLIYSCGTAKIPLSTLFLYALCLNIFVSGSGFFYSYTRNLTFEKLNWLKQISVHAYF